MVEEKQPLHHHLIELRKRLIVVVSVLVVFSGIGLFFYDSLQSILVAPLDKKLYYTSPAGGFNFSVQIALFFGVLCTIPVFLYQTIRFIGPALNDNLRKRIWTLTILSFVLAGLGACFAYFVSLPAALHFLTNFSDQSLESLITTQDYLSFLNIYILGFMLIFQIPLFVHIASNITPLPPGKLTKGLRVVIVLSVVASAIITPTTDPLNLAIMAVPMIVLYIFSILVSWVTYRPSRRKQTKTATRATVHHQQIGGLLVRQYLQKKKTLYFDVVPNRAAKMQKSIDRPISLKERAMTQNSNVNRQLLIQL